MKLNELLNITKLQELIDDKYITARQHPEYPYTILNYTDKCTYEKMWCHETLVCRGLIYNHDTLDIIASGMKKMFNYGETNLQLDLDTPITANNKEDGSLGICYHTPDGKVAVATRGSFTSDQAIWATKFLNERVPEDDFLWEAISHSALAGSTALVEIIYPENRIILDYGDKEELTFLGFQELDRYWQFTGYATSDHFAGTFGELLETQMNRVNAEGWIVSTVLGNHLFKLKQEDYLELARAMSRLSQKEVWRWMMAGTDDENIMKLPDEFHDWARNTRHELGQQADILVTAGEDLAKVAENHSTERKEQAMFLTSANISSIERAIAFQFLSNKDAYDRAFKTALKYLEPKGSGM